MKGLLIKDIKLLTAQKTSAWIILVVMLLFPFVGMEPSFVVGYSVMVLIFTSVNTVSYDDFDNGMAFLFTLPASRRTYVKSKYVLGLLLAVCGWIVAVVCSVIAHVTLDNQGLAGGISELFQIAAPILPIIILMWSVLLPCQLKFGAEKARVILFIFVGVMAAVFAIGAKLGDKIGMNVDGILNAVGQQSLIFWILVIYAAAVAGVLISYTVAVKIMEKKEY